MRAGRGQSPREDRAGRFNNEMEAAEESQRSSRPAPADCAVWWGKGPLREMEGSKDHGSRLLEFVTLPPEAKSAVPGRRGPAASFLFNKPGLLRGSAGF